LKNHKDLKLFEFNKMLFSKVFLNPQTKLFYFQGVKFIKEFHINTPFQMSVRKAISNFLSILEGLFLENIISKYYFVLFQTYAS
jgi:hypothetical protein